MQDRTLLIVALSCSIIGVIVLFFISSSIEIKHVTAAELQEMSVGSQVRLKGRITSVRQLENAELIYIVPTDTVPVMVFDNSGFSEGDLVTVTGEIEDYKGKRELIAERIE